MGLFSNSTPAARPGGHPEAAKQRGSRLGDDHDTPAARRKEAFFAVGEIAGRFRAAAGDGERERVS
jgi:hypothetical protein